MTITLSLWELVAYLVVPAVLIGFTIGAACMFGLLADAAPLEPLRVTLTPPLPPTLPLRPEPWESAWVWSEWAADLDSTLTAADAFIARHQVGALR